MPAYELLRLSLREGEQVKVDWTGWRADGLYHHLWDFVPSDVNAAILTVARSVGHTVSDRALEKPSCPGPSP